MSAVNGMAEMWTMNLVTVSGIDWANWQPQEKATLLFVVKDGKILLIHKKRGLGAGKVNGPGGHIEANENAMQAAVRETEEEVRVRASGVAMAGELHFQFTDGLALHCTVFKASGCEGEAGETDEATPLWVPLDAIPYDRMWADDPHWIPLMLAGKAFRGYFVFDGDKMLDRKVDVLGGPVGAPKAMEVVLSAVEARVLGSMIEKELTTPEYYPLTLNALTMACNQKNNRDPVLALDEKTVVRAIDSLREKRLAWEVAQATSRVPKYQHNLLRVFPVPAEAVCVLCELLLRGPQTVGELRTHTERMHRFENLEAVEAVLQGLMTRPEGALVKRLARESGRREPRNAHLLCGPISVAEEPPVPMPEQARIEVLAENERIARLEQQVTALQTEVAGLKKKFEEFVKQFG
jgi:uncharacterized protein YceH (UPF0502 family)/8-oxo-dGTP pyrophosphatase MutT (NUDIX family)